MSRAFFSKSFPNIRRISSNMVNLVAPNGCVHRAAAWPRLSIKPRLVGSGATFVRLAHTAHLCCCNLTDFFFLPLTLLLHPSAANLCHEHEENLKLFFRALAAPIAGYVCLDHAAPACSFHFSTFTPITMSHRESASSTT
jgi:hypothetical protein